MQLSYYNYIYRLNNKMYIDNVKLNTATIAAVSIDVYVCVCVCNQMLHRGRSLALIFIATIYSRRLYLTRG